MAIDDFGIGFASLIYLQRIPAATIKIDRSFVKKLGSGSNYEQLVKSIIQIGKNLDKEIVAEGVEKVEQVEYLVKNNCHKYQGYLFSKPMSINALEVIIKEKKNFDIPLKSVGKTD